VLGTKHLLISTKKIENPTYKKLDSQFYTGEKIMLYINSAYTQDAGCPIFPMEFIQDMQCLSSDLHFSFLDFNLLLYNKMGIYENYSYLKSITGGYAISFDNARETKIGEYRFEALPTLRLLLSLINSENYCETFLIDSIRDACHEYGMPYEKTYDLLCTTNRYLNEFVELVSDHQIVLNMPSVPSVFVGIWLAAKLKKANPEIEITGTGNQINVPEIANFAQVGGYIDSIINTKIGFEKKLELKSVLEKFKKQSFEYPLYYGLRIIPYELSHGCPEKCNFCTERMSWNHSGQTRDKYELKDVENCIAEIKYLVEEYKISALTFNDCMLNLKLPRYRSLIEYLKNSDLLLSGSLRIDMLDDEMINLLDQLKFTNLIIGLETLNEDVVDIYNKGDETYTQNAWEKIPKLIACEITPQINFIISHPYESDEDVLKSVSEIERFSEVIKNMGTSLSDVNAGEILINYPAEIYFRVLKDKDFSIRFHEVPIELEKMLQPEIVKKIKQIPYKALKNDLGNTVNKNMLLKRVQSVQCNDTEKRINHSFSVLYKHKEKLLKEWKKLNVQIKLIQPMRNLGKKSDYEVINALRLNPSGIRLSSLAINSDNEDNIVREILVLCLLGVVDMEANYVSL
jgi:hypothetical protein